jgi:hypothetical protein
MFMPDEKIIHMPAKPRSNEERQLLDDIGGCVEIKDADLRDRVKTYLNGSLALVSWYHLNGTRVSFEEIDAAERTRQSYNGKVPLPRIIGIKKYDDIQ